MVSNRKFSKVYDLVSKFTKKTHEPGLLNIKEAQSTGSQDIKNVLSNFERTMKIQRESLIEFSKIIAILDAIDSYSSAATTGDEKARVFHKITLSLRELKNMLLQSNIAGLPEMEALKKDTLNRVLALDTSDMVDHSRLTNEMQELAKGLLSTLERNKSASAKKRNLSKNAQPLPENNGLSMSDRDLEVGSDDTMYPQDGNDPFSSDSQEISEEINILFEALREEMKSVERVGGISPYSSDDTDTREMDIALALCMRTLRDVFHTLQKANKVGAKIENLSKNKETVHDLLYLVKKIRHGEETTEKFSKACGKVLGEIGNVKTASAKKRNLNKRAQVMSSAEQEAALKRDIEELMTKGVSSAVRPSWTQLVSAVNKLKTAGKLPASLDALAYYQVIVHGGVAYDRRVRFASALPKVVMDLAILASQENVTNDDVLITLSKTLNGPCDGIKNKYAQLVKLQDTNKTERDRNDFEERAPTPKDSFKGNEGKTLSLEEATSIVKGYLRELSMDGNSETVLNKFNVTIRPYLKQYSSDPDFNKSVRALAEAGIPVDPMAPVLKKIKRQVSEFQRLSGNEKVRAGRALVEYASIAAGYFKGNKEFSSLIGGVVDSLSNISDAKLQSDLSTLKSFI